MSVLVPIKKQKDPFPKLPKSGDAGGVYIGLGCNQSRIVFGR